MDAAHNKQITQQAFDELAKGNGQPFVDLMADDFCWTITGTTAWSRTYSGKQAVLDELLGPLFKKFQRPYVNTAQRIIAEDDNVVVLCQGRVMTKAGLAYNNAYCYVCRFHEGKMRELIEYLDTELVARVLGSPADAREDA
jgi:ketosteroid isomerase-like protein